MIDKIEKEEKITIFEISTTLKCDKCGKIIKSVVTPKSLYPRTEDEILPDFSKMNASFSYKYRDYVTPLLNFYGDLCNDCVHDMLSDIENVIEKYKLRDVDTPEIDPHTSHPIQN